jgi:AcrR family transcriptional regulator
MVASSGSPARPRDEAPRRHKLLEAALLVFARFGFRKTSMDEVARAADVSRQGLYLHFSTKEELFRATLEHALESAFNAVTAQLADVSSPLERRLVGAFDEWMGRYVGVFGAGVSDLAEASQALVGPLLMEQERRFVELLAKHIKLSGLATAYKPAGLTPRQLADTLCATARGLKHQSPTRAEFVQSIGLAVRAMCLPLLVGHRA